MSAELRVYSAGVLDLSTPVVWGDKAQPVTAVTVTPATTAINSVVNVPAATQIVLWQWTADQPIFTYARICVTDGSGYLDVYWRVDAADTSANDYTPLGTAERWNELDLSCFAPLEFTTSEARVRTGGTPGIGESSELPATGSLIAGRINKIVVENRSTTAAVSCQFTLVQ